MTPSPEITRLRGALDAQTAKEEGRAWQHRRIGREEWRDASPGDEVNHLHYFEYRATPAPDPYAHLKAALAEGKVIQFDHNGAWFDCTPPILWSLPPDGYRIKPWQLPDPPGRAWHRVDGWKEEWLNGDWRPVLADEHAQVGDDYRWTGEEWKTERIGRSMMPAGDSSYNGCHFRTRRPLPSPPKRVPLTAGDVRVGTEFRLCGFADCDRKMIGTITSFGIRFSGEDTVTRFETLQKDYEKRELGQTDWTECSKEEPK